MDIIASLFWCVLGIAGGAVVTIINNKRKRLARKMFTVNLISEKVSSINGLKIEYNSQQIKNLYSSTIQIKNTGNTTINSVDIPKKRPLSIYTDGIFIIDKLNMQLPNPNNENDIHITFDKNEKDTSSLATIDFEFLSPRQVVTITLLHTGNISLGKWMIKDGKILESNEILVENETQVHQGFIKNIPISICLFIIVGILILTKSYINNQNLVNHLDTLQFENDSMRNNIDILNYQINDLELEIELLKDKSILNYSSNQFVQ